MTEDVVFRGLFASSFAERYDAPLLSETYDCLFHLPVLRLGQL